MLNRRMRPTRTTSHIFRSFLQRNRPTIILVHTIRASIASTFLDLCRITKDVHGDSPLSPIIEVVREKFLKYWDEIPLITIIANFLHPSFKKKYNIRLLERYKKNLNLSHIREEQRVTSALEEMFNLYNTQLHANQMNQSSSSNPRNIRY
jgi:Domain of unknown function (DUF4413)